MGKKREENLAMECDFRLGINSIRFVCSTCGWWVVEGGRGVTKDRPAKVKARVVVVCLNESEVCVCVCVYVCC